MYFKITMSFFNILYVVKIYSNKPENCDKKTLFKDPQESPLIKMNKKYNKHSNTLNNNL